MIFTRSITLLALAFIPSIIAAPTSSPNSIVINIGGEDIAISSPGPVAYVSGGTSTQAKAIYFISNDATNNAVIAMTVAANGTLSMGSSTLTGGAGGSAIESSTGKPAGPDALFSQGAVKVAGNMMVAVNAGDNTMTMFTIDATDPTILTMVGKPVYTQGDFPVSVTLSTALNQACVANGGAKAGVACFSMCATMGLTPLNMNLNPFNLNQTTPPVGPFNTVSQVFFNEDSTALMTTVKGSPPGSTGFFSITPVCDGNVDGSKEVRSSPNGTAVLFGAANIPGNDSAIFVTDASFGAATLSQSSSAIATIATETKILDQSATCWATISDTTQTAFVTDVAVNHLVEIDYSSGQLIRELNSTNGNSGMIDLVATGNFIYALSPGNETHVAVFDVSGGRGTAKEIQNFLVTGAGASSMGMTFM